jgi:hypothetical protein
MAILFSVQYIGLKGNGLAAICMGNGTIVGFDGADGRYSGSYIESGGRIRGLVRLTHREEWPLVTGATFKPGDVIELAFDWPVEFAEGQPQQVFLGGQPVKVIAKKIGEIG